MVWQTRWQAVLSIGTDPAAERSPHDQEWAHVDARAEVPGRTAWSRAARAYMGAASEVGSERRARGLKRKWQEISNSSKQETGRRLSFVFTDAKKGCMIACHPFVLRKHQEKKPFGQAGRNVYPVLSNEYKQALLVRVSDTSDHVAAREETRHASRVRNVLSLCLRPLMVGCSSGA